MTTPALKVKGTDTQRTKIHPHRWTIFGMEEHLLEAIKVLEALEDMLNLDGEDGAEWLKPLTPILIEEEVSRMRLLLASIERGVRPHELLLETVFSAKDGDGDDEDPLAMFRLVERLYRDRKEARR